MSFARVRSILISLHRWIGLILTPVFLVIIVTGAVLSFRPILSAASGPPAETRVDATALAALATKLEAGGGQVMSLTITDGGRTASVASNAPDLAGQWDIATATRTGPPESGFDLFRTAQQLHKSLLLGLSLVVEVASFAMLAIMVAGPFLAWLRLRNTLMGWHMAVGWLLLPALGVVLSPVMVATSLFGNLSRLDYIKCDIEGYEGIAIPLFEEVLRKHRPLLQIEIDEKNKRQLLAFLEKMGYQPFWLDGELLKPMSQQARGDLFFIPSEKIMALQGLIVS